MSSDFISQFISPEATQINTPLSLQNIKRLIFEELKLDLNPNLYKSKRSINFLYNLWTYNITSRVFDRELKASGEDIYKQKALIKCLFEYLERLSLIALNRSSLSLVPMKSSFSSNLNLFKSSNGFAAHTSLEEASLSAIIELLERDTFLYYWFTKTSPFRVTDIYTKDYIVFKHYYKKHRIEIEIFEFPLFDDIVTIVPIYYLKKYDIKLFSFSSHIDKTKALTKSLFEGFRYINRIIEDENYIDKCTANDIEPEQKVEKQFFYYMKPSRKKAFDFIVNTDNRKKFSDIATNHQIKSQQIIDNLKRNHQIDISIYLAPVLEKLKNSYVCVKAFSPDLQEIFWGNNIKDINKKRFSGKQIIMDDPHPIP